MSYEHLSKHAWKTPSSYAGFSPIGDYLVYAKHRQSHLLDECNYDVALKWLRKVEEKFDPPPEMPREHIYYGARGEGNDYSWVYTWSASCSLVGWHEYLMVRADAPTEILDLAEAILKDLDGYPVLDDDLFCQLEWDQTMKYWEDMSIRERLDTLQDLYRHEPQHMPSIFAVRDDCLPSRDDFLYEHLRG